jgi:hypothetical protein
LPRALAGCTGAVAGTQKFTYAWGHQHAQSPGAAVMAGVAIGLLRWHAQTCRLGRVCQRRNGAWEERKRYRNPLASGQKTELQPIPSQSLASTGP